MPLSWIINRLDEGGHRNIPCWIGHNWTITVKSCQGGIKICSKVIGHTMQYAGQDTDPSAEMQI